MNAPVTCGIYLYSLRTKKMLVCHATNSRWTQWSIPKGLKSSDEDSLVAAHRELKEETGIDLEAMDDAIIHALPKVKYQKQNKFLESFLVTTNYNFEGHIFKSNLVDGRDFPEIDSWKWVTLEQATTMLHESQRVNLGAIATLNK